MRMNLSGMFELYDKENPAVYEAFKKFAHELRAAGNTRGGAGLIFERIRWETKTRGAQEVGFPEYKLNNNYRAFYARKLIADDPSFESFFELREQKSLTAVPA